MKLRQASRLSLWSSFVFAASVIFLAVPLLSVVLDLTQSGGTEASIRSMPAAMISSLLLPSRDQEVDSREMKQSKGSWVRPGPLLPEYLNEGVEISYVASVEPISHFVDDVFGSSGRETLLC